MDKRTTSLALIVLFLALVSTYWFVSTTKIFTPLRPPLATTEAAYVLPATLSITHSSSEGMERYTGSLPLSACQNLESGVIASGSDPTHAEFTLKVTTAGTCPQTTSEVPFAIGISTTQGGVVLDRVYVNNNPAQFAIVDAHS